MDIKREDASSYRLKNLIFKRLSWCRRLTLSVALLLRTPREKQLDVQRKRRSGESSIMFTEFTDLADGGVFLSSNREGDLTDARNRLHHSRRRTKTVYAPRLSLNCLTVAALHLVNLE